jgi:tetratricopeptide (TPR) repeat protein
MGRVYKARQKSLPRVVALKVMLGGAGAGPEEVARFRKEAGAMARLRHPNVVPIYEVGEGGGGPYLAMELLEGGSLAARLGGRPLPDHRAAAALLEVLARAVHYAHQQGIVHRDLKPANVLLAADGTPKLTDFGLAKRLDADSTLASWGAIVGTPSYMAPEQAGGVRKKVGPAADVYALGAVLYELLTGRPPFAADQPPLDTIMQVLTEEPVPPRRMVARVPRDLEVICLKCLRKEPHRRYASAEALADDLRRYAEHKPIQARPVGAGERLWRWCQRKPVVAGLLAALLVVLVAGAGGITWKWREAVDNRKQAERERDDADRERAQAQKTLQMAVDNNLSFHDLAEKLKQIAGTRQRTVKEILQQTAENYERLLEGAGENPRLLEGKGRMLNSFSEVYRALGDSGQALASAREARALFEQLLREDPDDLRRQAGLATGQEREGIALGDRGDLPGALAALHSSLALREGLAGRQPDNPEWQMDLSTSYSLIGYMLHAQGDFPRAEDAQRRALAIRERPPKGADSLVWQGKRAGGYLALGHALSAQSRTAEALAAYEKAIGLYKGLAQSDNDNAVWQQNYADVLVEMGGVAKERGDVSGALGRYDEALAIAERLAKLDPGNREWERQVLTCRYYRADLRKQDNLAEAHKGQLAVLRELLPLGEARAAEDRANAVWQSDLARFQWLTAMSLAGLAQQDIFPQRTPIGGALASATQGPLSGLPLLLVKPRELYLAEARALMEQAVAIQEKFVARDASDRRFAAGLASMSLFRGEVLAIQGDPSSAGRAWARAEQVLLDFYRAKVEKDPGRSYWQGRLAERQLAAGYVLVFRVGQVEAGLTSFRAALSAYERLAQKETDNTTWQQGLADAHKAISAALEQKDRPRSLAHFQEAIHIRERLAARQPRNVEWHRAVADAYRVLVVRLRPTDPAGAQAAFQKHLDALARVHALAPAEAQRDPFAVDTQFSTALQAQLELWRSTNLRLVRNSVGLSEWIYRRRPTPDRAADLVNAYIDLVRVLDTRSHGGLYEARRAVRRCHSILRQLQQENKLHKVQERLLGAFEAKRKSLPPAQAHKSLESTLQQALDDLDYRRLARTMIAQKRQRDLLDLLSAEARDTAGIPWLHERLQELILEPALLDAVLQAARQRLKDDPRSLGVEGRALFASLARNAGDPNTAVLFDPAILKTPQDARLVTSLEQLLYEAGHFDRAAQLFGYWVRTNPGKARLIDYRVLAGVQWKAGRTEEAIATLQHALRQAPGHVESLNLLGLIYHLQRRFTQARAQFEQLLRAPHLEASKQNAVRLWLADVYAEQGEFDKAEEQVLKVLAAAPKDAGALVARACFWIEQGKKLDAAEALIRQALKLQPHDARARFALGWVLARQKHADEGLPLMEKESTNSVLATDPSMWERLGDGYRQVNRLDKARASWQKALEVFPKTTDPADRRRLAIERKLKTLN